MSALFGKAGGKAWRCWSQSWCRGRFRPKPIAHWAPPRAHPDACCVLAGCCPSLARPQMLTLARPHRSDVPDGQVPERAEQLAAALLRHPTLEVTCVTNQVAVSDRPGCVCSCPADLHFAALALCVGFVCGQILLLLCLSGLDLCCARRSPSPPAAASQHCGGPRTRLAPLHCYHALCAGLPVLPAVTLAPGAD
jgi:hypothetical protein